MKIVSLLPSATEIVYALGLGDDLEAVTYECDHPPEARDKPVVSRPALSTDRPMLPREIDEAVGGRMDAREPIYLLDRALIQRIQPDVILAQDLCRVCAIPSGQVEDALRELGVQSRVLSLDPDALDDIFESILAAGRVLGREDRAAELVASLRERVERVRRTALRLPSIRVLALEWSDPPFAGGHWIPDMVEIAGGVNVLSEKGKPSRRVSWREIADATPEVIVFMPCGYYLEEAEEELVGLFENPDFASTPAAREGAVFAVDASSFFSRPGPRIVDGLEALAWAIHPRAYPEPTGGTIARVRAAGRTR
ncbi:MAG: cobalamin-binding protein [Actinobacteria bacterium]|nr:cobalamin-binding protein [Actinomycetota bacterium]